MSFCFVSNSIKTYNSSYSTKFATRLEDILLHKLLFLNDRKYKCSDCQNSFSESITCGKKVEYLMIYFWAVPPFYNTKEFVVCSGRQLSTNEAYCLMNTLLREVKGTNVLQVDWQFKGFKDSLESFPLKKKMTLTVIHQSVVYVI